MIVPETDSRFMRPKTSILQQFSVICTLLCFTKTVPAGQHALMPPAATVELYCSMPPVPASLLPELKWQERFLPGAQKNRRLQDSDDLFSFFSASSHTTTAHPDLLTPINRVPLAAALFCRILPFLLTSKFRIKLLPPGTIPPANCMRIQIGLPQVKIVQHTRRIALIWLQAQITAPGRPPALLNLAGTGATGHLLLHSSYMKRQADVLRIACLQAAHMLMGALLTDHTDPLASSQVTLALPPAPLPSSADVLLFSMQGARALPQQLKNLPSETTYGFLPNLLPVIKPRFIGPDAVRAMLIRMHLTARSLWQGGTPRIARIVQLGSALHTQLLLQARITDVEVNTGPARHGSARSACHAHAAGALIAIPSGTVLWSGQGSAVMSEQSDTMQAQKQVVRDAERFALGDLSHRFQQYRDSFLR